MTTKDEPCSVGSADVKRQAALLGFDLWGVAPASAHPELGFFNEWLDREFDKFHPEKSQLGGMKLLETFLQVGG